MANAAGPQSSTRTWATVLHLSGLIGFLLPPLNVLLPLCLWSALRRDPTLDREGRLALNFQLSMLLYLLIGAVLLLLMPGVVIVVFVAAAEIYATVSAAVHAARGQGYRYPLSLRFIPTSAQGAHLHAA